MGVLIQKIHSDNYLFMNESQEDIKQIENEQDNLIELEEISSEGNGNNALPKSREKRRIKRYFFWFTNWKELFLGHTMII